MACVSASAQGEAERPVRPYAGYSIRYDDNVLGLPNPDVAREVTGSDRLGDVSKTAEAGVLIDKQLSQQHITGSLGLSRTRYEHFTPLDYEGKNFAGNWNWHLGKYFQGNIGASYIRTLSSYTDFHQLAQNIRTQKREYFDGRWHFHPTWQLRSGISRSRSQYDLLSQQVNNYEELFSEVGVDYLVPSGSTFGLVARHGTGKYPNPQIRGPLVINNDYDQDELKARIDWRYSGKTRVLFSGGAVWRHHASLQARDFRGSNARLTVDWAATGKTQFSLSAWRELAVIDDLLTAYSVNQGISLTPRWLITDKLQTELQMRYETRDFRQSQAIAQTADFQDTLRTATWSLSYSPELHWLLQASAFYVAKNGPTSLSGFTRRGLNLGAQYRF